MIKQLRQGGDLSPPHALFSVTAVLITKILDRYTGLNKCTDVRKFFRKCLEQSI